MESGSSPKAKDLNPEKPSVTSALKFGAPRFNDDGERDGEEGGDVPPPPPLLAVLLVLVLVVVVVWVRWLLLDDAAAAERTISLSIYR